MFISVTQQRVLFSEVEGLCWYHLKGHFFQSLKVFCLFLFIYGMLFCVLLFSGFPSFRRVTLYICCNCLFFHFLMLFIIPFSVDRLKLSFISLLSSWVGLIANENFSFVRILLCIL